MSSKYALEVKNVSKSFRLPTEQASGIKQAVINRARGIKGYKEQHVLKDISFKVEKGDFFGIVGRNGSGKSTLLKLISQIYTPDSGSIKVNGTLVPFIELGVGFNPELTGRENVYMNGALLGFSRDEVSKMYPEIVEFAELEEFMDQKLKNYSSGMQVRLAFSIAIKAQGDILVLDEVLAVGDESFQRKCSEFFDQIKKDKSKTVILVTHSMSSVRQYCNKAVMIEKGKIVSYGNKDEVADEYSKQFIEKTENSIIAKNRYGTGDITIENVDYKLSDNIFTLKFNIKNNTDKRQNRITIGMDFCINGDIVLGNDTRFMKQYKNGISVSKNSEKSFEIEFPNNFGNYNWTLSMNTTTELGNIVNDHIREVLKFSSSNVRHSNAWKGILFPKKVTIKER